MLAAGASARHAIVTFGPRPESLMQVASPPVLEYSTGALFRDRVLNATEVRFMLSIQCQLLKARSSGGCFENGKFLNCLVSCPSPPIYTFQAPRPCLYPGRVTADEKPVPQGPQCHAAFLIRLALTQIGTKLASSNIIQPLAGYHVMIRDRVPV